jgi:hypothetical protein
MTAIGPFTISCYDGLFEIVGETAKGEKIVEPYLMTREAADWLAERTTMTLGEIVLALEACFAAWLRDPSTQTTPHGAPRMRTISDLLFHLSQMPVKPSRSTKPPIHFRVPRPKQLPKHQAMQKKRRR